MSRRTRAFTLVELLVVIAIIILLISMLVSSAGPVIKLAKRASCASQLKGLGQVYLAYVTIDSGVFPPIISSAPSNIPAGWDTRDGRVGTGTAYFNQFNYLILFRLCGERAFSYGFGPLVWDNRISPDYFICPLAAEPGRWWSKTNSNPDELRRQWSPTFRFTVSSVASYSLRSYLDNRTPQWMASQGKRALMCDTISASSSVLARHEDGVNVFYTDGSVDYRNDQIVWDNPLSWSYWPANGQELEEIWSVLDGNKQ